MDIKATHHVHTGLTQDHREAAKAFAERREPPPLERDHRSRHYMSANDQDHDLQLPCPNGTGSRKTL
jgi:hypothetical protein